MKHLKDDSGMVTALRTVLAIALLMVSALATNAQTRELVFATVERPPFVIETTDGLDGFSVDLIQAIGREIGADITFEVKDGFPDMLYDVERASVDGAIANISITGAREAVMDFTQPIFRSGLQIMVPLDGDKPSVWGAVLNRDLGLAVVGALGLLLAMGMLMWAFERRKQSYFDASAGQAVFPAFWYALNLVVNGGFEQNVPRSAMGRLFAVLMVLSSLFVVSFFVANITTAMTVRALESQIDSISDLEGRLVATTTGSTASEFLAQREISHTTYADFSALLWAFEDGELDAVFFDSPLLAYYASTEGRGKARLVE
ncbi:MAG: transporter substrate-binding domain-containing protein, partial [Tateyamaria sp.]